MKLTKAQARLLSVLAEVDHLPGENDNFIVPVSPPYFSRVRVAFNTQASCYRHGWLEWSYKQDGLTSGGHPNIKQHLCITDLGRKALEEASR